VPSGQHQSVCRWKDSDCGIGGGPPRLLPADEQPGRDHAELSVGLHGAHQGHSEKLENKLEELHFLKDFFKPSQFILPFLCVAFSFDTFEIVSIH